MDFKVDLTQTGPSSFQGVIQGVGIMATGPSQDDVMDKLSRLINQYQRWERADYTSQDNAIVVGGAGRSGTRLLAELINAHPETICGIESKLFCHTPYVMQYFPFEQGISCSDTFVSTIVTKYKMPKELVHHLLKQSSSYDHFIELFHRRFAAENNKTRWADKTPDNIFYVDRIFKSFPNTRFIHIIRDGRDVACSRHHNGYGDWEECIDYWMAPIQAGLPHRDNPQYKEIFYEDLISDPAATMSDLFKFMDVSEDLSVIERFYKEDTITPINMKIHKNLRNPINKTAYGRWKNDMDATTRQRFKEKAGDLLIKMGYEDNADW